MIRLINRRLIIPRGDTGSFTVPVLTNSSAADISVFTIFDCLTRRKVFQKEITAADNTLTVEFTHEDTVNLVPGRYVWDIKYYKNPTYADGELIDGEEVDSYYAGFSLPICEIKETGDTLLLADDAPTSTMSPLQLNVINAAISETNASKRDAATSASAAAASASEANASAAAALQSQTSAEDAAGAAISAKDAAISASEIAVSAQENAAAAESNAQDAASTATTKAEEASQSAADALSAKTDALAAVSEISNLQVQTTTLNPTSTATASYNSNTGILSLGIPRGHGVASIAKTATNGLIDTYTITFTNGNTTTFNITNGDSGVYYGTTAPTNPNVNVWIDPSGTNNLAAPTISVSNINDGKRLTITDVNGAQTADILNGSSGTDAYVWIRYSAAQPTQDSDMKTTPDAWMGIYSGDSATVPTAYTAYTWYNIKGQTGPVSDVQVNGTSVVTDGVANVPTAGAALGVVRINSERGINVSGGLIFTNAASTDKIKAETDRFAPIVPYKQHESVFYGLAKAAGADMNIYESATVGVYTEREISAIHEMLNAPVIWDPEDSVPSIYAMPGIQYVCGECATLDITLPASGCIDVVFESGSTATVLNFTLPTAEYTLVWENGFDPTSLEANATYEINIKIVGTKCLGVAAAWT